MLATWKLAPALACGNAVVLKPHPNTPLSSLRLAELASGVGLPDGLLSVLPGGADVRIQSAVYLASPSLSSKLIDFIQIGDAIARHPDIDKVSFTGSGTVGRRVMQAAAESNLKRVTLELGGKSPMIVFPDLNDEELEACIDDCAQAMFSAFHDVTSVSWRCF